MGKLIVAVFTLGVIVGLFFFDPHTTGFFPPCPFRWAFGFYCPGCGSTRALHLLLHGRFLEALSRNPLMVCSLPLLVAMTIRPSLTRPKWVPWCALCILVAYGILRNIPYPPFYYLAP